MKTCAAARPFVAKDSVVRRLWGDADMILLIFAGAAAEFALNKAVDWLYFTGKLPADPLGRLFSTVGYARRIVFASLDEGNNAIDTIRQIHSAVEGARGAAIPEWAYHDVLFMLIHYTIAAGELLGAHMEDNEKAEVYDVFYRVGVRMGLKGLPLTYLEWLRARETHLCNDLAASAYTADLFRQYKKHLGALRFKLLIESQKLLVPRRVRALLGFGNNSLLSRVIPLYKLCRLLKLDWVPKALLLPSKYRAQIKELDMRPSA